MSIEIGILLALLCAFVGNLGFFLKHRGACEAPPVDIRHPLKSGKALFSSKWFALGMLVASSAWAFHVAALAMAPMTVVQVALASAVVMTAVMADRIFGFKVGKRQWVGLGLTAAGLAMLAITMPAVHGAHSSYSGVAMLGFEAGLLGLGGLMILGRHHAAPEEHHGVVLGAAAGILFGVSDVAIKALTGAIGAHGVMGIFSPWMACTLIASVAAFYASARGLQDGEAVPVIAITGTAANIAGIAGGILVFGDPLPGDAFGLIIQGLALVMVVVASALTPAPVRSAGLNGAAAARA
jgi:drug/metabolite transporter (DMT)-like permease